MLDDRILRESRLLIVDDNPSNVLLVERLLEWGGYHNVKSASDADSALRLQAQWDPDLIILDLHMPHVDGFEVMRRLRERGGEHMYLPILVFTADATPEARKKSLALGASDFLTKPGEATEVNLRVRNFLQTKHMHAELSERARQLEDKVAERTLALWNSQLEVLERLSRMAELRDDDAADHCRRVGEISARIATGMGWKRSQIELIRAAAPLHDIGKVGLPEALLTKPGKLSAEELDVLKRHVTVGADILAGGQSPLLQIAEVIARHHHERWDGSGYPAGLRGEDIPIEARIVAIADSFDSSMIPRAYRKALNAEDAMAEIALQSGILYDPAIVSTFVGIYRLPAERATLLQVA